jgi:hypothetical protein
VKADIIARGYNEYVYFINPLVTFNGDRVSYMKTYIKKKKDTVSTKNQLHIFSPEDVEKFEAGKL